MPTIAPPLLRRRRANGPSLSGSVLLKDSAGRDTLLDVLPLDRLPDVPGLIYAFAGPSRRPGEVQVYYVGIIGDEENDPNHHVPNTADAERAGATFLLVQADPLSEPAEQVRARLVRFHEPVLNDAEPNVVAMLRMARRRIRTHFYPGKSSPISR